MVTFRRCLQRTGLCGLLLVLVVVGDCADFADWAGNWIHNFINKNSNATTAASYTLAASAVLVVLPMVSGALVKEDSRYCTAVLAAVLAIPIFVSAGASPSAQRMSTHRKNTVNGYPVRTVLIQYNTDSRTLPYIGVACGSFNFAPPGTVLNVPVTVLPTSPRGTKCSSANM